MQVRGKAVSLVVFVNRLLSGLIATSFLRCASRKVPYIHLRCSIFQPGVTASLWTEGKHKLDQMLRMRGRQTEPMPRRAPCTGAGVSCGQISLTPRMAEGYETRFVGTYIWMVCIIKGAPLHDFFGAYRRFSALGEGIVALGLEATVPTATLPPQLSKPRPWLYINLFLFRAPKPTRRRWVTLLLTWKHTFRGRREPVKGIRCFGEPRAFRVVACFFPRVLI